MEQYNQAAANLLRTYSCIVPAVSHYRLCSIDKIWSKLTTKKEKSVHGSEFFKGSYSYCDDAETKEKEKKEKKKKKEKEKWVGVHAAAAGYPPMDWTTNKRTGEEEGEGEVFMESLKGKASKKRSYT